MMYSHDLALIHQHIKRLKKVLRTYELSNECI